MKRRDFMRNAAMTTAGMTVLSGRIAGAGSEQKQDAGSSKIHYEVHGGSKGKPLFLGFPIMASYGEIFGAVKAPVLAGFLDRLTDRYRVLVVDYPSIGKSEAIPPSELTADRVCADVLRVASEAGFDRFVWWGNAWGAIAGLQLASRSDRVSALVCGGWTPLGGDYAAMLRATRALLANPSPSSMAVLRDKNQFAQWVTFLESIQNWPEAQAVARIKCPKMVFFGANAEAVVPYVPTIRERRKELEAMGWQVTEIPERGHSVGIEPATLVPIVREFLDKVS